MSSRCRGRAERIDTEGTGLATGPPADPPQGLLQARNGEGLPPTGQEKGLAIRTLARVAAHRRRRDLGEGNVAFLGSLPVDSGDALVPVDLLRPERAQLAGPDPRIQKRRIASSRTPVRPARAALMTAGNSSGLRTGLTSLGRLGTATRRKGVCRRIPSSTSHWQNPLTVLTRFDAWCCESGLPRGVVRSRVSMM